MKSTLPMAVTSICVTAGFALAMAAIPPPRTPEHVAQAYVDARLAEDWPTAWAMQSSRTHDAMTFAQFVDRMSEQQLLERLPANLHGSVKDVEVAHGLDGPALAVRVDLSRGRDGGSWTGEGVVHLIAEDGDIRVVSDGFWRRRAP